jgi:hypothetical protein
MTAEKEEKEKKEKKNFKNYHFNYRIISIRNNQFNQR